MPDERLEVSVTFDERGYIGSAPELRQAVVALSLGGLRRKIEIAMLPDDVRVVRTPSCKRRSCTRLPMFLAQRLACYGCVMRALSTIGARRSRSLRI